MPANIFHSGDYDQIRQRIQALAPDQPRKWGKMTLDQMLAHCSMQLKHGLGQETPIPVEGPFYFRTWPAIKFALYYMPWKPGLPTASTMNMVKQGVEPESLEAEKKQLIDLLEQVQSNRDLGPHPLFGPLNEKDWGRLIWKHLDHHLRQFGG